MKHHTATAAATGLALLCATAVVAGPAQAQGGSTAIQKSGNCVNGAGVWNLKAKPDNGLIEIEFEVDTNHVGQLWHVRVTDNRQLVLSRDIRTQAPSGSFTVRPSTANRAGTDTIRAHAFRGDRVCGGKVQV